MRAASVGHSDFAAHRLLFVLLDQVLACLNLAEQLLRKVVVGALIAIRNL